MEYKEILNFLFNSLPMYQRIGASAYKADLSTSINLDKYYNHPHQHYKTIHIAGTNGKGSVSHSIASILQTAGYKVGLYTSPHLVDYRERIRVNGEKISKDYVTDFINNSREFIEKEKPSFFEMSSEMALCYFRDMKVDIAVIEVGMGGRLDSTNVITPMLSIITNISLDHTQYLGKTISDIAKEKAGIIKENVPLLVGEYNIKTKNIFTNIANEKKSPIHYAFEKFSCRIRNNNCFQIYKKDKTNNLEDSIVIKNSKLGGSYQRKNFVTIVSAIKVLEEILNAKISNAEIISGIENVTTKTGLRGRWQIISEKPLTICDTGHNFAGLKYIFNQLEKTLKEKDKKKEGTNKVHFVIGFVSDKDTKKIFSKLLNKKNNICYYLTQANIPRAMKIEDLVQLADKYPEISVFDNFKDVKSAYLSAKKHAKSDDIIFIGGSTFVVADYLEYLESNNGGTLRDE